MSDTYPTALVRPLKSGTITAFGWEIPQSVSSLQFETQAKEQMKFDSELPNSSMSSTQSITTGSTTVTIPSFTATGRSFSYQTPTPSSNNGEYSVKNEDTQKPRSFFKSSSRHNNTVGHSSLEAMGFSESMTGGSADILPIRYHDDSLILIPVLPEPYTPPISAASMFVTDYKSEFQPGSTKDHAASPLSLSPSPPLSPNSQKDTSPKFWKKRSSQPTNIDPSPEISFSLSSSPSSSPSPNPSSRTSKFSLNLFKPSTSSSTSTSTTPSTDKPKPKPKPKLEFTMKKVPRAVYLKNYAKDEQGQYIGTEPPAADCILRCEEDLQRWRPV